MHIKALSPSVCSENLFTKGEGANKNKKLWEKFLSHQKVHCSRCSIRTRNGLKYIWKNCPFYLNFCRILICFLLSGQAFYIFNYLYRFLISFIRLKQFNVTFLKFLIAFQVKQNLNQQFPKQFCCENNYLNFEKKSSLCHCWGHKALYRIGLIL